MICITGDVHHASMETTDQQISPIGIGQVTERYVDISAKYDIDVTLFVTGKFCEELSDPKTIHKDHVEIGGHTWSAFKPRWPYTLFSQLFGATYGPRVYQRWDIRKTIRAVKSTFGGVPTSWRTHAYDSNEATLDELAKTPIEIVSDEVTPDKRGPHKVREELFSLPINVLPDHEHIYHGERTREHVAEQQAKGWCDAFTAESYPIDEYYDRIYDQIDKHLAAGGVATLLLHPICMQVADDFEMFEQLCQRISSRNIETVRATELLPPDR